MRTQRTRLPLYTAIGLVVLAALVTALIEVPLNGVDWNRYFYPAAIDYLTGQSLLYDAATTGFYHPPWVIWYVSVFALFTQDVGLALLRVASIAMVAVGAWAFTTTPRERTWGLVLAVFNLYTHSLVWRGQITAVNALGAALAWWAYRKQHPWLMGAAYLAFTVSLPNTVPFALVLLWFTWQNWPRATFWKSTVLPFGAFLISLPLFGLWPVRWVENVILRPPSDTSGARWFTTIWRATSVLDLPTIIPVLITGVVLVLTVVIWRRVLQTTEDHSERMLFAAMLFTAAFFIVTPWALSYRYVLLYAVVVPWLLRWRLELVLACWALSFLPVARYVVGIDNTWIEVLYPTAIFAVTAAYLLVGRFQPGQVTLPQAVSSPGK